MGFYLVRLGDWTIIYVCNTMKLYGGGINLCVSIFSFCLRIFSSHIWNKVDIYITQLVCYTFTQTYLMLTCTHNLHIFYRKDRVAFKLLHLSYERVTEILVRSTNFTRPYILFPNIHGNVILVLIWLLTGVLLVVRFIFFPLVEVHIWSVR